MDKYSKERREEVNEQMKKQAKLIEEATRRADWEAVDLHTRQYNQFAEIDKKYAEDKKTRVANILMGLKIAADMAVVVASCGTTLYCATTATVADADSLFITQKVWNLGLENLKNLFKIKK